MIESIAIWGASGHGRVVLDAVRGQGAVSVVGFIDDDEARKGQIFAGVPILGGREMLPWLTSRGVRRIHVAVGHCATRMRISTETRALGFALETVIHPNAILARDAGVGEGTFIAAGVVLSSAATVGCAAILNTACSVDHDCVIGDGAHIAPGARLGGLVNVGAGTFVGIGATILNCLRVGERTIIGGGALVVCDLPSDIVAYGVPARIVRERRSNE